MGPTYTTTVDLSTSNGSITVASVSGASTQLTAVSFLSGPKGDKGDTGAKGDTGLAGTTDYNLLLNKPTIPTVPTLVSAFTNDSGYLTSASLSTYATQSYVTTAVNSLVNGSPAALDTLKELADALGDDANFATTVTNSLATKAPLSSPSFTGMVTSDNVLRGTDFELTNTNGSYAVNAHYNAGWKYISTGSAFLMNADGSGGMYFYTAPSGTAGTAISFTERLHITSTGLIGNGAGLTGIPESAITNLTADLGSRLIAAGTSKVTVGTAAPSSPSTGDLWVDTN